MKRISLFAVLALSLNPVQAPLVSLKDFLSAHVSTRGERTVLHVTLKEAAANRLKKYSKTHVGGKLAVFFGDRVIEAPVIRVPITGPDIEVDAFSPGDASALAAAINQGALTQE